MIIQILRLQSYTDRTDHLIPTVDLTLAAYTETHDTMLSACILPLFLLFPAFTTAVPGFVAYKELTCSDPIDIFADGEQIPDNKLKIDHAITEWDSHAAGHYYDNLTFPDAAVSGDDSGKAGTQFVYWGVEKPDPGCQFIMMKDTPYGWQVISKMPGTEILRVAEEGCYFTPLTVGLRYVTRRSVLRTAKID